MKMYTSRFAALALGLIAVSLLVFQPICEAGELRLPDARAASQAATAGDAEGEFCCAIGTALPVKAASAAAEEPSCPAPEAGPGLPALRPSMLGCGAATSAAPPPPARYHARSARIQR
jgi:hypothetical protein